MEKKSDVVHAHAQFLARPVWARWERQIIGADKMRNAARRGNSLLEEVASIEDWSLILTPSSPSVSSTPGLEGREEREQRAADPGR